MNSIQGGLSVRLLAGLVGIFFLQWLLVGFAVQRVAENYVLSRLEHDAESLLVALSFAPEGHVRSLDPTRLNPVYNYPFSGHYFHLSLPDVVLRSRSLWDQELDLADGDLSAEHHLHKLGPEEQRLLVVVRRYRKRGVPISVVVAEDLTSIERDVASFRLQYAVLSLGMLALLVVLLRLTVRRGLRPLTQAQANLVRLEQGEVKALDEAVPIEIQPLVREINRLVRITSERLTRSRNALGNLAHALKTPLTVLKQLVAEDTLQADPDLRHRLERQMDMIQAQMERQLRRARLAGDATPGSRFAVDEELTGLVDALVHLYREKDLDIQCQVPPGSTFAGDREDMLELLGNLLDNACKWAQRRVRVIVEKGADLAFSVDDDGPGVPSQALSELTRRGVRVDESTAGHGLGLGIAHAIVRYYGGSMAFGSSAALGGFQVQVRLPVKGSASGTETRA